MPEGLMLITGATGHLGFRTLGELVRNGYRARTAHRRVEQIDMIKAQKSIRPLFSAIEFTQVSDTTTPGVYDTAIKGVVGVIHHASSMPTFKKLMSDPAVKLMSLPSSDGMGKMARTSSSSSAKEGRAGHGEAMSRSRTSSTRKPSRRVSSHRSEDPDILVDFDLTSTEKALGFQFAGAEETVKSVVGQYLVLEATT